MTIQVTFEITTRPSSLCRLPERDTALACADALPRLRQQHTAPSPVELRRGVVADCPTDSESPIRVVIADDGAHSRAGLRALLATSGSVEIVGEAADGEAAVWLSEDCRPDVVLMDVRMPHMDGLEATRRIKDRSPEVKVIILTMYADCRCDAEAAGADAFLVKGCPAEALFDAVSAISA